MSLYDVNGNTIAQDGVTSEQVKTALMGAIADGSINLGSAVGATLAYNNLPAAWLTNANAVYAALLAKYKALANGAIPFFCIDRSARARRGATPLGEQCRRGWDGVCKHQSRRYGAGLF